MPTLSPARMTSTMRVVIASYAVPRRHDVPPLSTAAALDGDTFKRLLRTVAHFRSRSIARPVSLQPMIPREVERKPSMVEGRKDLASPKLENYAQTLVVAQPSLSLIPIAASGDCSRRLLVRRGQIQQTKRDPGQKRPEEIEGCDRSIGRGRVNFVARQLSRSTLVHPVSSEVDDCCRRVCHLMLPCYSSVTPNSNEKFVNSANALLPRACLPRLGATFKPLATSEAICGRPPAAP